MSARKEESAIGRVYMITPPHHCVVKIGFATNVSRRLYDLQMATFMDLDVFDSFPGALGDEKHLHRKFATHRIRGEWFKFADEIFEFVDDFEDYRRKVFERDALRSSLTHASEDDIWASLDDIPIGPFLQGMRP